MTEVFIVKYTKAPNCFLYLTDGGWRKITGGTNSSDHLVQLKCGEKFSKNFYFSYNPSAREKLEDNEVGVSARYAQCLGIANQEKVILSFCVKRSLTSVFVRPRSEADNTILINFKDRVENRILDQVRVVQQGQTLPVQIYRFCEIYLIVENLQPDVQYGLLEQGTDLVILDPKTATNLPDLVTNQVKEKEPNMLRTYQGVVVPSRPNVATNIINNIEDKSQIARIFRENDFFKTPRKMYFHTCSSSAIKNEIHISKNCFYVTNDFVDLEVDTLCCLSKVEKKSTLKLKNEASPQNPEEKYYINVRRVQLMKDHPQRLFVPSSVLTQWRLDLGCLVTLSIVKNPYRIHPSIIDNFPDITQQSNETDLWGSLNNMKEQILDLITTRSNILILGNQGCGKSVLIECLITDLKKQLINCVKINCKPLKGKKPETIEKTLTECLSECSYQQPSCLILDDLHGITAMHSQNEEESTYQTSYVNRIGLLINNLIEKFQKQHQIQVIATAHHLTQLGSELNAPRGPRLFETIFQIPELTTSDRKHIFNYLFLLKNLKISEESLVDLVNRTGDYSAQDLSDLVDKINLKSLIKNGNRQVYPEDVNDILSQHTPMSLHGVQLSKDVSHVWDDIGGLSEAKTVLNQLLKWPSMYPELFASCPLRHQSGLLLYGAPGTGKTLIAGAAAHECRLNFISVKGPELLSKYIGASEEGVRNLFIRAQKARPCVLFFDEFDSLAPRRGHDSTGVTDRVVNQLLTQLDGVEALTGVFVIAASSRPDLLDPALLRPGRLDKAVCCQLPNKDDRTSILKALSRKMSLALDVDLDDISERTEDYTGADLHAVLYNAQTNALKEDNDFDEKTLQVTQANLLEAVKTTKPSLTSVEKLKYKKIYETFVRTSGADFAEQERHQQRVTLA